MKENYYLRFLATMLVMVLVTSSVFYTPYTVSAAEADATTEYGTTGKSISESFVSGNSISENFAPDDSISGNLAPVEKELLQCDSWVIFRTFDDNGNPEFEVSYEDKTVEDLQAENFAVQYRTIYKNDFQQTPSEWYDISEKLPEEITNSQEKEKYFIQFRMINDTTEIKSGTFTIYKHTQPYATGSSLGDYCATYSIIDSSNRLNFRLAFNEHFHISEDASIIILVSDPNNVDTNNYYNLAFDYSSSTWEYSLNDKVYIKDQFLVYFYLELAPVVNIRGEETATLSYKFIFNGFEGESSHEKPQDFILNVCTPTLSYFENRETPDNSENSSIPETPNIPETPDNPEVPTNPNTPGTTNTPDDTKTQGTSGEPEVEKTVDIKVSNIELTAEYKTVKAGKKVNAQATISPFDATNQTLTWTSSNEQYATVNSEGVVTTKKAGIGKTVTITAEANDGSGKKATIKIKIVKNVKATKIKLSAKNITVKAGKKVTIKATFSPSNVSSKKLTWTSSNKKYATVNSKGVVTTKKAGKGKTVKITAKAKDGSGKKATIKLKIK